MQVEHVHAHHRFVARLAEGDAVLAYQVTAGGAMDIRSTYVPPSARGRGTGGALVEAAFVFARAEGRAVIPTCLYIETWLRRHPEFRDIIAT